MFGGGSIGQKVIGQKFCQIEKGDRSKIEKGDRSKRRNLT